MRQAPIVSRHLDGWSIAAIAACGVTALLVESLSGDEHAVVVRTFGLSYGMLTLGVVALKATRGVKLEFFDVVLVGFGLAIGLGTAVTTPEYMGASALEDSDPISALLLSILALAAFGAGYHASRGRDEERGDAIPRLIDGSMLRAWLAYGLPSVGISIFAWLQVHADRYAVAAVFDTAQLGTRAAGGIGGCRRVMRHHEC